MSKKRAWTIVALVVVGALVAVVALRPAAVTVDVALVGRDTLQVGVVEEGRTRVRDRFTVAAPVAGRLRRIDIREGQTVGRGDVVARLDPVPEDPRTHATTRARLAATEAHRQEAVTQLARLVTEHEQASREAERRRALALAGAVSTESREQAELAAASAQRQVEAARSTLLAAEADVEAARSALIGAEVGRSGGRAATVRSPVAGLVLRVLEESERVVVAGTPLLELGNTEGLEIVVDVLSQDAARMAVGNPLYLSEWGGDQILEGRVRLIEPAAFTKISALGVEEQRVNVIGDVLDPPPSLGTGFRVEARIVTWAGADVLAVPTSALFRDADEWQVFVVEDGRAKRRTVRLGHRSEAAAEVKEGVLEGDRVILFPSDVIAEDVRVRPARR